jgi:hypothetical protein
MGNRALFAEMKGELQKCKEENMGKWLTLRGVGPYCCINVEAKELKNLTMTTLF